VFIGKSNNLRTSQETRILVSQLSMQDGVSEVKRGSKSGKCKEKRHIHTKLRKVRYKLTEPQEKLSQTCFLSLNTNLALI
jgi:hypothetical protein